MPHPDVENSSNDENDDDDEAFHDLVMSPALSSASDSSCSATDIGRLFCDTVLLSYHLLKYSNDGPCVFFVLSTFVFLSVL